MKGNTNCVMWSRLATRITVIAVLSWLQCTYAQKTPKKESLDAGTVQMLSNILESLDTFRNDRLRDLEKIKISVPPGNGTTVTRLDDVSQMPANSSVADHIKALKEGIMGHNPVKKTFGYKVTVYTSPIGQEGKDGKPVLVTQYVGGDMMPDSPTRRVDETEDLQESANHPDRQLVHSSESTHLPIQVSISSIGGGKGLESSAAGGGTDHNRKTEHSESSEKGHQNGHALHTKLAKGHDHEKHSAKHDEHHKETEKESHRHDEQAHDKGGATQQGIRERTEIEYYEREHFLDTEYDKAKAGHDKTHGVKEHESHNDHDSHEDKKLHSQDNSQKKKSGGATGTASSAGQAAVLDIHSHYTPPLPVQYNDHPHVVHKDHLLQEDSHSLKEDAESSRLHHSEESKGHREHNSERDHQSEEKDKGYLDKDKGRRKEGYRERGYKITAEREYFLNDAHHDKGTASHTSGHKLKDQEGAAHGSKDGERDRGFVKEEKKEEAHDAAYDSKDKRYYDGEAHSEGFSSEKTASSSGGQKKQKEEVIPLAPPIVNYVEEDHHAGPPYPLPIVYAPSNDGAQALLAYPPDNLSPTAKVSNVHGPPTYSNIQTRTGKEILPGNQQPLGGYDDDKGELEVTGYVGHASYKKRTPSPLVAAIRDNVRKDVHSKPPAYSKTETTVSSENSVPSSENAVRFPNDNGDHEIYRKGSRSNDEAAFTNEEAKSFTEPPDFAKEPRRPNSQEVYFQKETLSQPDPINSNPQYPQISEQDLVYLTEPKRKRPDQIENSSHNLYAQHPNGRDNQRHQDSRSLYVQGANNANKLLRTLDRSAYPQIQSGTLSTVGDLIQEIKQYPQVQEVQRYPQRNVNDNTELAYADLHHIYNLNPETHGQRQLRTQQSYRSPDQPQRTATAHQQINGALNHQKQLITRYNHLNQNSQQLPRGEELDQHISQRPDLLHLQQQQQIPQTVSALEQLQQQTKPPFSPVVLLSRGPPAQKQNQAVDVWYTRQRS